MISKYNEFSGVTEEINREDNRRKKETILDLSQQHQQELFLLKKSGRNYVYFKKEKKTENMGVWKCENDSCCNS